MAENTPEQRIAELEAENVALKAHIEADSEAQDAFEQRLDEMEARYRAMPQGSTGPLHPAQEPQYMNGSVVLYDGALHRVVGRSMTWSGETAYDLEPTVGRVVHVTPDNDVRSYALSHSAARDPGHVGRVTYDLASAAGERVFEVAEQDLEAFRPEDISPGLETKDHHVRTGARGDLAQVSEGGTVSRE